jgi:hypothetical protein
VGARARELARSAAKRTTPNLPVSRHIAIAGDQRRHAGGTW